MRNPGPPHCRFVVDRQGDWTSTAYWYQINRTKPLPDVGAFEDRIPYAFGGLERWPGKDRKTLPF